MSTDANGPNGRRPSAYVRPHILIVTSDEDLRDFLQEGLVLGGFWVSVIASGVQTIEVFRLRTFDLVLIDSGLTGLNALELIRRLRRQPDADEQSASRTDVPILVIVDAPGIDPQPALTAGADAVLEPPLDLDRLLPLLHRTVLSWREQHPGRPWADEAAQLRQEQEIDR